jgi:hypothetical protein
MLEKGVMMRLFEKGMLLVCCIGLLSGGTALGMFQEELTEEEQRKQVAEALAGVRPAATEFDFVTFDLARTTVILRGFTIGENRKEDCATAVKEIPWVGHVLNYVEALPASYNDEKLRENIRFILRKRVPRMFSDNKAKIRIKVSQGSVTLIGAVEEDEVEPLERAIGEIKVEDLVRSVENKTVVRQ